MMIHGDEEDGMRLGAKLVLGRCVAKVVATYAEFVLDFWAPRSNLKIEGVLAALTLTSYGDYSTKVDQARAKYGDRVRADQDVSAAKWTITLDGSIIEEGRIVVKLAGMYGVFAVGFNETTEGIFPFSIVAGDPTLSRAPSVKILQDRFEGSFPAKFLAFADADRALDSCQAPQIPEIGFRSLGAFLRIQSQTFCVVHWKGAHPSSMLITVTLADGDPWMRPFSRWICRAMTTTALRTLTFPDRPLPTYAACVLVDRPDRRRPGDAQDTYKSVAYEIRSGTPARMN
jgi:hypothetical protein